MSSCKHPCPLPYVAPSVAPTAPFAIQGQGAAQLELHKHGPAPNGVPLPSWHHVSFFTHPMVPSVVSIIMLSITFSIRLGDAVLFVMAKTCLILQICTVSCNSQGVHLIIREHLQLSVTIYVQMLAPITHKTLNFKAIT